MNENSFMRVDDVARELDVSKSYAYKLIQRLNAELREKGYLTISGRVSRRYFTEKLCYGETERGESKWRHSGPRLSRLSSMPGRATCWWPPRPEAEKRRFWWNTFYHGF